MNEYLLKKRRRIEHEVIENIVVKGADVHPEYSDLFEENFPKFLALNSVITLAIKFLSKSIPNLDRPYISIEQKTHLLSSMMI